MSADAPSLLSRIVVRLSCVSLAMIVLSYGWMYLKVDATARAMREKTLIEQGHEIARHLHVGRDGAIRLELPAKLLEAYNQAAGDYRFAVREEDGRILFASGPDVGPVPVFQRRQRTYWYDPDGPGQLDFFGAAVRVPVGGRTLIVQVEQTGSHTAQLIDEVTDEFLTDGGWLGAPLLLLMLAVSIVTIRGSLMPIRALSRSAARIRPGHSGHRLPETGVPREILPLVQAINAALDRLDHGIRIQQEFTADAAHELRTPLAILAAHIDTLEDRGSASALRRDVAAMARIVEQLLAVARLEAHDLTDGAPIDLNSLAQDVAATLGRLAVQSGCAIEVDVATTPVRVRGNGPLLWDALRNLIENALAHAPVGSDVRVTVTEEPAIAVSDSGPGVPEALRDKVVQRFWRGDRSKPGAGLGLAIVLRTIEGHGGRLSIGDAPGGGACFTLHFPRPERAPSAAAGAPEAVPIGAAPAAVERPLALR